MPKIDDAAFASRHGRFASNDLRYRDAEHPANTQWAAEQRPHKAVIYVSERIGSAARGLT